MHTSNIFLKEKLPRSRIAWSYSLYVFYFDISCQTTLQIGLTNMPYTKTFPSLTFLPVLTFSEFLAFTNLIVPHCGFYVPDHQQSGALCICLLAIQGSFSIKGFLCSFIPSVIIVVIIIIIIILQYWVGFFVLTYGSSLCLQDTNPCHPFAFANIFFQSSACLFTLFMVFLDVQMFLNFSIVKDQLYFYVCFNFVT